MSMQNQEETQPVPVGGPLKPQVDANPIEETKPVLVNPQPSDNHTVSIETEALPEPVAEDPVPQQDAGMPPPQPPRRPGTRRGGRRFLWALLGVILVVIVGGIGSWLGYRQGLAMRLSQEQNQVAMAAVTQFQLGMEDENAGRFEMARKRYEYVVRLDPNFPGVQERLTAVMLYMAETAVPTEAPTATAVPVTPTPDMRGIEEKLNHALALLHNREWDNAITTAELVRKEDIQYRAADVDGILYIALRFRGIQKIQYGNLEPGIYDLTLSSKFAPLDNEAEGYRRWARYYLSGSSFWEVDWESVVRIFGEIYPYLPNLRDGSGWTAQERFRVGSIKYADQLVQEGKYCEARQYYTQALALAGNETVAATATAVQLLCEPPAPTATPTLLETPTPTGETTEVPPTEDLTGLCCPPPEGATPDPRCATYTCPSP